MDGIFGSDTFIRNHMEGIASIHLFVVPTIAFQQLFAFLVLGHERRRLLWFAVTRNPTAEWLARQITEAFPWNSAPKYLIRDNDRAFGVAFPIERFGNIVAYPILGGLHHHARI